MRVLIATDAWAPQINGVVQTLTSTIRELTRRGIETKVISSQMFRCAALPGYPEIRLSWPRPAVIRTEINIFNPDYIHIATEGPIGWATRHVCVQDNRNFTTSYHTRFPEYLRARLPVPLGVGYSILKRFHNSGNGIMVATPSMEQELSKRGFQRLLRWGRGVDLSLFHPKADTGPLLSLPRPIFLSVGRLAPEKNLDAFLSLKLPGTKLVIGDGPSGEGLKRQFPDAVFLGARNHEELPALYAQADVFVFPSRTDTFGLVLVEALACGLPVAALPAPGPVDVIGSSGAGVISDDLREACISALHIDKERCRRHAESFTWEQATNQFLNNMTSVKSEAGIGRYAYL